MGPSSRLYQSERDLLGMYGLLMEARARTDDWRYPHLGDLAFWFFMVLCHQDPRQEIRLWHDAQLVGYAILGEDPSFDCQVLPEYAGAGIEDEALAWAEARVAELCQGDAARWGGKMVSGARQDDAQRRAFLERHGFCPSDYIEVNYIRSLDEPIPAVTLAPRFQVRAVAEAEVADRAAAQREVWQPWTVGDVSEDDYRCFMRLPGYQRDLDVVAVSPDGAIAAYVNGWIDPVNHVGDFGPVGARPAYRRQGLTRAVLLECMRRMKAHGMDRVSVSTGVGNAPARGLYESVGFRVENQFLEYAKPGSTYSDPTSTYHQQEET